MEQFTYSFHNNSETQNNDIVFEGRTFDLTEQVYVFDITPDPETMFWRWGIALFSKPEFSFEPHNGRYANRELRYIEVDAGVLQNQQKTLSNRLELANRNIRDRQPIAFRTDFYQTGSTVQVVVRQLPEGIEISLLTGDRFLHKEIYPLTGFTYFKIFAWADYHSFTIRTDGRSIHKNEFGSWIKASLIKYDYGVLLLPDSFAALHQSVESQDLTALLTALQSKSPSIQDLLQSLLPGTLLLTFCADKPVCGICLLAVENTPDLQTGQLRRSYINRLKFNPYIPFSVLIRKDLFQQLPDSSQMQLKPLSVEHFQQILETAYQFPVFRLGRDERSYLEILYRNLLDGKNLESIYALRETWHDHAPDFDASQIDPLLLLGPTNISLFGISAVHPESALFEKFDQLLFCIQKHLSSGGDLKRIEGRDIVKAIPDLTKEDLVMFYKLMPTFSSLNRGMGNNDDGFISFFLDDKPVYDTYKTYRGLQQLVSNLLKQKGGKLTTYIQRLQVVRAAVPTGDPLLYARLKRVDRQLLSPVMGVTILASHIAGLIRELKPEKGQMIGVFGKWGRGKSYFVGELWKILSNQIKPEYIRITYDAWKYKETPASWAYMYEVVAKAYLGKKDGIFNRGRYWWRLIRLNYKRKGIWPIVINLLAILAAAALWAFTFKYHARLATLVVPSSGLGLIILLKRLNKEYSTKALNLIRQYTIRHNYKTTLGIQAELQEELIKLLQAWIPEKKLDSLKILLDVEDLDRCGQEKVMEIIDALRLLLDEDEISKRMTVIIVVDERTVKSAVGAKLAARQSSSTDADTEKGQQTRQRNQHIGEYMDKLFISAIKLGELSEVQKREFAAELLKDADIIDTTENSMDTSPAVPLIGVNLPVTIDLPETLSPEPVSEEFSTDRTVNLNTAAVPQIPGQGITRKEKEKIIAVMSTWTNATPRNIYIFYYRYILAKNMLLDKYTGNPEANGWQGDQGINDLLNIIRYFSDQFDPGSICILKDQIAAAEAKFYSHFDIEKSKEDWFNLLDILETVIAY